MSAPNAAISPSWKRAPLGAIGSPAKDSSAAKGGAERGGSGAGPAMLSPPSGSQKRQIDFIQEQHSHALALMLAEIDALKAENRDLKFRLVMRDSSSPGEDAGEAGTAVHPTVAYEERVAEVRALQAKLEAEQQLREDMAFDHRMELKRLREVPSLPAKPGTQESKLSSMNSRLRNQVSHQKSELKKLLARLQSAEGRSAAEDRSEGEIPFSTRAYVHKFENVRQSPIETNPDGEGEGYDNVPDEPQLDGRIGPKHAPRSKIDMRQLSTITQNRKVIRQKTKPSTRDSWQQRQYNPVAASSLPSLDLKLGHRSKEQGRQFRRHY